MYACLGGQCGDGALLARKWGNDLHAQDVSGRTVLMYAARGGDVEVVRLLLDNGADLHAQNAYGITVLMWDGLGGVMWRWCVFWLKTALTSTPEMLSGTTVLMYAARGGDVEVARLLVDNGSRH